MSEEQRGELRAGTAAGGALRWAAVDLVAPLRVACARQDLSPVAAGALGRCLAAACLLQRAAAKTPSRLVLELSGDGPLKRVLAEVRLDGSLRGMVGEPRADLPATADGDLDVGRAIGSGLLKVWRLFRRSSYQSHVELEAGGVGSAITHFLRQSEQTRSAALLGVLAVPEGIAAAGGLLLEVLPGAGESAVARLEENLAAGGVGPSRLLADGGLEALLDHTLDGLEREAGERTALDYRCGCSRDRIGRYLAALGEEDRAELVRDDGAVEAECVFCGARYAFEPGEVGPVRVH